VIKIVHYRSKCIGCGACVELAPNFWEMSDEDGKSHLLGSTTKGGVEIVPITDAELAENEDAALACPVNIIHIEKR